MMWRSLFGRGLASVLIAMGWATWAGAQRTISYGPTWVPSYGYPYPQAAPSPYDYGSGYGYGNGYGNDYGYGYGNGYGNDYGYGYGPDYYSWPTILPPFRWLPGFSYNANPYQQFPNSYSYGLPPNAYMPNTYTYDLRAYGYGYTPGAYVPPVYPYGYDSPYRAYPYYYRPWPSRRRGAYQELSLGQYIRKQLQGPVRVGDIVPGIPELGGGPPSRR